MTLDAAFAGAAAALMESFGSAAVYTPPDGAPVPTLASQPQRLTRVRADGMATEVVRLVRMPAADVPAPQRGASLTIGADNYVVDALDDDDGSVVTVTVRPA
jgi:hypothetical protein